MKTHWFPLIRPINKAGYFLGGGRLTSAMKFFPPKKVGIDPKPRIDPISVDRLAAGGGFDSDVLNTVHRESLLSLILLILLYEVIPDDLELT